MLSTSATSASSRNRGPLAPATIVRITLRARSARLAAASLPSTQQTALPLSTGVLGHSGDLWTRLWRTGLGCATMAPHVGWGHRANGGIFGCTTWHRQRRAGSG